MDEQGIKNVSDILEKQGPAGTIQGVHLSQPPDFRSRRGRNQQRVDERGDKQSQNSHRRHIPHGAALKIKHDPPDDGPHHHHRMQAYHPALDELLDPHLPPAVVISVADHEPGQDKEKIDRQITMIDILIQMAGRVSLKNVEPYHHDGRYPTQPVENMIMRFCIRKRSCRELCF